MHCLVIQDNSQGFRRTQLRPIHLNETHMFSFPVTRLIDKIICILSLMCTNSCDGFYAEGVYYRALGRRLQEAPSGAN